MVWKRTVADNGIRGRYEHIRNVVIPRRLRLAASAQTAGPIKLQSYLLTPTVPNPPANAF
jgi:hypothetical protein